MLSPFLIEPLILTALTAFTVVAFVTKPLIKVSHLKNLVDTPDDNRKIHKVSIPSLGGIVIFAATLFALFLWFPTEYIDKAALPKVLEHVKYIVATLLILFFIGVKDDIIGTAPEKKLLAHIVVAFILVLMADIRITGMKGLFGIHELPYWASIFLSVFTYIVVVNAYNLIDGIDGLAAGVGVISAGAFGSWFFLAGDMAMACLSFSLVGALLGFLIFNFSPAKIFMGDSGSLTIGLIISVLSIQLIEYEAVKLPNFMLGISKPVFVLSCLSYPLIDTLRVFIFRTLKGRSPFSADRNHIHHRLIDVGFSHTGAALFIYVYSALMVYLALLIQVNPNVNFISMIILAVLPLQMPYFLKKRTDTLHKNLKRNTKPFDIVEKAKEILSN